MFPLLPLLKLLRPKQWVKNVFLFMPLFFTPELVSVPSLVTLAAAFMAFSLLSSSVYIVNDYFDRDADRLHPEKKYRPLASGAVSPAQAFLALPVILMVAGLLALYASTSPEWLMILVAYGAINVAYSFWLKHIPPLDVFIVSSGFVLRVIAGAALAGVEASAWMVTATAFATLFVTFGKRREEMIKAPKTRKSLQGYNVPFLDAAMMMMGTASVLCYTLYTLDANVQERLHTHHLYLTSFLVVLGFLRYLQLSFVEEKGGNPTELFLNDKFLMSVIFAWGLTCALLLYL